MKEIIVHIGMHKTGSTAIQKSLDQFENEDISFISIDNPNASRAIVTAFSRRYLEYEHWKKAFMTTEEIEQLRSRYRADLQSKLQQISTPRAIISGEDISSFDPQSARKLLDYLANYADTVRIISYVRDPLSLAVSAFQEQVKNGQGELPKKFGMNYQRRIQKFVNLVGHENMIVREYAPKKFTNGCVVEDFCELAGIDASTVAVQRANESLTADAVKAIYYLNASNPLTTGEKLLDKAKQHFLSIVQERFSSGQTIDKSYFFAYCEAIGIDYLAARYGIDFSASIPVGKHDKEQLKEWLSIEEPHITESLTDYLSERGVGIRYPDLTKVVNRLYYHCLQSTMEATTAPKKPARRFGLPARLKYRSAKNQH